MNPPRPIYVVEHFPHGKPDEGGGVVVRPKSLLYICDTIVERDRFIKAAQTLNYGCADWEM